MPTHRTLTVAIADDHTLLCQGLVRPVDGMEGLKVVLQAANGQELIDKLERTSELPDICLMDVNMPVLNGFETTRRIRDRWPQIRILALSVHDAELSIIRMIRNGAGGYLLKDYDPAELRAAILSVAEKGHYHSELVTGRLLHLVRDPEATASVTDVEMEFLGLCCSELSYKEIGEKMHVSGRTVEGYRNALFSKLQVHTRAGLVLYAVTAGLVSWR